MYFICNLPEFVKANKDIQAIEEWISWSFRLSCDVYLESRSTYHSVPPNDTFYPNQVDLLCVPSKKVDSVFPPGGFWFPKNRWIVVTYKQVDPCFL